MQLAAKLDMQVQRSTAKRFFRSIQWIRIDSIPHEPIWKALDNMGVPQKLTNLIKKLYREATRRVLHNGQINIGIGVGQGCPFSPLLFNVFLEGGQLITPEDYRGP